MSSRGFPAVFEILGMLKLLGYKFFIIGVMMGIFTAAFAAEKISENKLPEYVAFDFLKGEEIPAVLHSQAAEISLPLGDLDKRDIKILLSKFDAEENCAGLAAPQLGISKQVIIFAVPYDPNLKLWRPDLTDTMPKTVWINPTYKGIEESGDSEDYEGCFSVIGVAGQVKRYNEVEYAADEYTSTGEVVKVAGKVKGFLARAIQHEIDHLDGILWIDRVVDREKIKSIEEYRRLRQQAIEQKQSNSQEQEEL